jgi:oxygen-independent coproporphyrinogen-3 oxidase
MIREFILQMKLGHVRLGYFTEKFGVDIARRFAGQLSHLGAEGLLTVTGDEIRLTRDGLLCVDTLLHEFFLQQHRTTHIV